MMAAEIWRVIGGVIGGFVGFAMVLLFLGGIGFGIGHWMAQPSWDYNDRDCEAPGPNDEPSPRCHEICREGHSWFIWGHHTWCYWDDDAKGTSR